MQVAASRSPRRAVWLSGATAAVVVSRAVVAAAAAGADRLRELALHGAIPAGTQRVESRREKKQLVPLNAAQRVAERPSQTGDVPVVLDSVVGSSGELARDGSPLVAVPSVSSQDEAVLLFREGVLAHVRVELVAPPGWHRGARVSLAPRGAGAAKLCHELLRAARLRAQRRARFPAHSGPLGRAARAPRLGNPGQRAAGGCPGGCGAGQEAGTHRRRHDLDERPAIRDAMALHCRAPYCPTNNLSSASSCTANQSGRQRCAGSEKCTQPTMSSTAHPLLESAR